MKKAGGGEENAEKSCITLSFGNDNERGSPHNVQVKGPILC